MMTRQPKKMMIIYILDILRKYTDANHRLSQKEIENILRNEYNMPADRKAVRRNLMNLIDSGYNIEYSESVRMVQNSKTGEQEESYILTDFYLSREFTDGELRLLIDSLLFSQHIPYNQCRDLVKKLEGLSSKYFHSRVCHIARNSENDSGNQQLFLNIELLNEAIQEERKVAFEYLAYGTDKHLHPRVRSDGSTDYVVSPYQMAAKEGKYYLICNFDKYNDISNYRIDRISNIRILKDAAKPFESLQGSDGNRLDLADYMKKHVYMYSSGNCRVKFRICRAMIGDVIDLFGKDVVFSDETDDTVTVSVYANEMSAIHFALNSVPDVTLLEPKELRETVKIQLEQALEKYKNI